MQEKILELLREKFKTTNGGCAIVELMEKLELSKLELETHLRELYKEKKIKVRQGVNYKIIYEKN